MWYALQTRFQHERRVAEALKQKGIPVFLPLYKAQRQWSDRRKVLEVPLFSCYVFVHFVIATAARGEALRVSGVLGFVSLNGSPTPIPTEQIENVRRALERSDGFCPSGHIRVGQRVRIRGGALDGVEGVLLERNNDRKLIVSIDLLQQSMAVTIDGYDLEAA